jgi:hypothetical protein
MSDIETAIRTTTEYRRDGDSDWEPLAEAPPPVQAAIIEEIAEAMCRDMRHEEHAGNTDDAGTVQVDGITWEYRR